MLGYANTVKKQQLIQQNKDSLLHFMQIFLIFIRSILPMRNCIPHQQVPRKFIIKERFEESQIPKIGQSSSALIPHPLEEYKNILIPDLIIPQKGMDILYVSTLT